MADFSIDLVEWSAGIIDVVVPIDDHWEQVTIASAVASGEFANTDSLFVHFAVISSSIDGE